MGTSSTMMRLSHLRDGVTACGPQTLHIDVTNTCNTNCVTCWDHSPHLHTPQATAWKRQKVALADVVALLDDVQTLDTNEGGLSAVIVSGMGEPFTHPEIYELIADVKRRGLHLTIITNLVAADVERVVDLGVDALLVGVQGASEDSYLAFHPNFLPWHWQTLNASLQRLQQAPAIDTKHVQVICAHNAHELSAMVQLAFDVDAAQVNFKLASLKAGTEAVRVSREQRLELLRATIPAARALAAQLGMRTNLDVFAQQVQAGLQRDDDAADDVDGNDTAPIDTVGCFLGGFYARVTVEGTVLFCCNTEVVVGSLATLPFSAWWRSLRWDYWRRRMREGRYLASCFQCGKFNQNEKLSRRFKEAFGEAAWLDVTGRGAGALPNIEPPPRALTDKPTRHRLLPVLP
jgi:wyosine [tRNA(Phe)-imidazoG37] synthetase (radical SAM superfamily)